MRTSIKILIAALALVLTGLLAYDTQLKAEYLKGNYKRAFGGFVPANFNNFNAIELQSGTAINLMVVKGPYKVTVDPTVGDFVKISQQGSKLIIRAVFKDHYRGLAGDYVVFVSCPELSSFSSNACYTTGDITVTDTTALNFAWRQTVISGFTNNNMLITESNASNVMIRNCRVDTLKAIIGISNNSGSDLTIGAGNYFKQTDFDIRNKSTLMLKNIAGGNINYHLADSAQLMVNGASQPLLKLKQP